MLKIVRYVVKGYTIGTLHTLSLLDVNLNRLTCIPSLFLMFLLSSRGSYPAVSTRYSKDLCSLVDSCLKHNPRQRPSVNGILRLPFITNKIENLLSETVQNTIYL